ncbi:MAG: hypothetical protein JXB04_09880 [Kiritimatiellae bacterium]|nr:hypothetical protein [Kiritimatiellia bacterium]
MKRSPMEDALISNLGPSKFSGEGFLGDDARPLDEILAEDLRALEAAGVTVAQVVAALKEAYEMARAGLGAEVEIRTGVKAVFHESMGRIPSPFRGDGVFEKGEAVVTEKATGRSLVITRLGIALIEKHVFFQGRGCRYRIDPGAAVELLGLQSAGGS